MRPAGQMKLGFFPAPEDAVRRIASHLYLADHVTDPKRNAVSVIDPCAGQGKALSLLLGSLLLPESSGYAIELDEDRGAAIKAQYPGINSIFPATFHGCRINYQSFGLAYVNPPFDNELGTGQREELSFVERATHLLMKKGILVLVCPSHVVANHREFVEYLDSWYEDIRVYRFPDNCRKYKEIVVIGRKRSRSIPIEELHELGSLHQFGMQAYSYPSVWFPEIGTQAPIEFHYVGYGSATAKIYETRRKVYEIPRGWKPHTFHKFEMTDRELSHQIRSSPLGGLFREPESIPLPSPPLPLDRGHLGLILASGMLDGDIQGPDGPHIIRGSNYKKEYYNSEESSSKENDLTGEVTSNDVFSEKIITVIRYVDKTGMITTHSNDDDPVIESDED